MALGPNCAAGASRPTNWSLSLAALEEGPAYNPPAWPRPSTPVTVLQLSDLHLQLGYKEGAPVNCDYPLCCQPDLTTNQTVEGGGAGRGARRWGEYTCDLPPWTLEASLAAIARSHPAIDYIILTGDLPAHDIWRQSKAANTEITQVVAAALHKHFPDTPVLPAIGNHESFPVNLFPDPSRPGEEASSWLYASTAKYLGRALQPAERAQFAQAGFYAHTVLPGLTVISLNTNFCNNLNLWLLPSPADPAGQLTWLVERLLEAEAVGTRVHIISHIPPGSNSCLSKYVLWPRNYQLLSSLVK